MNKISHLDVVAFVRNASYFSAYSHTTSVGWHAIFESSETHEDEPSAEDLSEGRRLMKLLREKFPSINLYFDVIDECVVLTAQNGPRRYSEKELCKISGLTKMDYAIVGYESFHVVSLNQKPLNWNFKDRFFFIALIEDDETVFALRKGPSALDPMNFVEEIRFHPSEENIADKVAEWIEERREKFSLTPKMLEVLSVVRDNGLHSRDRQVLTDKLYGEEQRWNHNVSSNLRVLEELKLVCVHVSGDIEITDEGLKALENLSTSR
jgi:hypothetical protein